MSTRLTQPLDAEEARLANELARLGDALPPPALDSRIRAEAHAAVRRSGKVASRSVRRWGGALAAVLALGVGIKLSLEPTPLSPGMMPSDSAVSEQTTPAPVAADQALTSAAESSRNTAADVSQSAKQAELKPAADAESSLGRAAVQSGPIAERRDERAQDAETAAVIESKEADAAPASEADLRAAAASDPIAPDPIESAPAARPSAPPVPAASLPAPAAFAAPESPPAASTPAENEPPAQVKRQAFETNDAAEANSFGARSKAADAGSDVQQLQLIALDELIREARQLAMSGNRDDLQRVLKQIARDYPEAQLPDDIRELIAADQPSR